MGQANSRTLSGTLGSRPQLSRRTPNLATLSRLDSSLKPIKTVTVVFVLSVVQATCAKSEHQCKGKHAGIGKQCPLKMDCP